MIVYGSRASNIGNFEISNIECSHCNQNAPQRVSVFGKYAHIFWIPLFPIGKKAVSECTNCLKTSPKKEFPTDLNQAYSENKHLAKRPFWHWIGLIIVGGLIALMTLIGITAEEDPRDKLLDEDISQMSSTPTMESDSISHMIKVLFDNFVNEEIYPEDFKYRTRIEGDKALILVKMPDLKDVEKSARGEVMEMIEMITSAQDDLKGKTLYIGIHGAYSMMLTKTPAGEQNSSLASTAPLLDFYGPKPPPEK